VSDKRLTDSELGDLTVAYETCARGMSMFHADSVQRVCDLANAVPALVAEIREHRTRTAPAGLPVDPEADALAAKALNARAKEPRKLAAGLTQEERAALEFARNMADSAAWNDDQRRCVRVLDRLLASTAPAPARPAPASGWSGDSCARCEGDGEVSHGSCGVPDCEHAEPCPVCGGHGKRVTDEEVAALRREGAEARGDQQVAEAEVAAYRERESGRPHPFDERLSAREVFVLRWARRVVSRSHGQSARCDALIYDFSQFADRLLSGIPITPDKPSTDALRGVGDETGGVATPATAEREG
jgi:hypothetical protein